MCISKSKRHGCLQGTLLFLLVLCVLFFGFLVVMHLTVFYLTESSVGNAGPGIVAAALTSSKEDGDLISSQSETNENILKQLRRRRQTESTENINDQIAKIFFTKDCLLNQWIVQSSILLEICNDNMGNSWELMSNVQFNQCLRQSYWYIGISCLVPFCLTFITLIAVCRLCTCPIITMALVYIGLSLAIILTAILYKSGIILTDGLPLFITMIALVCLYALLALLLILLFGLVTCERKRANNGDNEKIMKLNGTAADDEDEIDDPNVPLYKNGLYSQQKRTDFDDKIKDFKYIDDDMSYVFRRG